ncbi:MAG: thiamine pyrophosphate-binding protein [Chloroflexi bacterium]|nr:thiamine pyrophosphate-binding protein [Chloroflexota bacterium]
MNRYECLEMLAPKVTDEPIITNLGGVAREWHQLRPQGNLYQTYLGHATSLALGLALALPHRRVLSLDGDGSMLFALTVLPVIARQDPPNLIAIIFDNEAYEATGGLPTLTSGGTDLAGMARAAGIRSARLVREPPEFREAIDEAFRAKEVSFIVAKVDIATRKAPYPTNFGIENKLQFLRYIEKVENIQLLKPPRKMLPQDKLVKIK